MAAKAIVVFNIFSRPVPNAEVLLSGKVIGLTNEDGYVLSPFSELAGPNYVRVIASGYSPAVYRVDLDNENQEIHLGGFPGQTNTVLLPALNFKSAPVPEPTREQVCDSYNGFQGITIHTKEFGDIPAFGPETSTLSDEDLVSYCQQMRAYGFTHVEFDISWRYSESDYSYPVPGRDLTNYLDEVCRRLNIIINCGLMIKFSLAGDGLSTSDEHYNDPQGWTYGYEWLCHNLSRILLTLKDYKARDLTKFIIFVPGYDGVFYGWTKEEFPDLQPARVIIFGRLFRSILPNGYLGIEHTPGNIPVGEGSANWRSGGVLDAYDTLYGEFNPFNLHQDSTWQVLGRMCIPFIRPDDMPVDDDPNPEFYLVACSRGKRFYVIYEFLTYQWVRGKVTREQVLESARYLHNMAPRTTICALLN